MSENQESKKQKTLRAAFQMAAAVVGSVSGESVAAHEDAGRIYDRLTTRPPRDSKPQ